MDKVVASAAEAVADIPDGATLAVGGFGLCGIPSVLIQAVLEAGTRDLEVVSNNCGVDDWGLGLLLGARRLRRMVASYVGENKEFARQYLAGELEVELTPQGTLAERMRAGGSGIAGVLHPHRGRHPGGRGRHAVAVRRQPATSRSLSPPKETQEFDGREYVLERAIVADFGLVRAWKGDRHGNLVYRDVGPQLQPARRDVRPGHDRRGRAPGRAGRDRPERRPHPGRLRAAGGRADAGAGGGQADREAHRAASAEQA